ncbi:hypothetical protein AAY473_014928 [Plecturocebus cupreus]
MKGVKVKRKTPSHQKRGNILAISNSFSVANLIVSLCWSVAAQWSYEPGSPIKKKRSFFLRQSFTVAVQAGLQWCDFSSPQPPPSRFKQFSCSASQVAGITGMYHHAQLILPGDSRQRSHMGHQRDSFGQCGSFASARRGASQYRVYGTDGLGWSYSHKENSNWKH